MAHWNIQQTDADLPLMARTLGIHEITARVMANRGIRSRNAALRYLSPGLTRLYDPFLMKDAEKAVRHIAETAVQRERIMIYGDYDADGIISTVILYKLLKRWGADVDYYIPLRAEEGYGLNMKAIYHMRDAGVNLIVTVDNGVSALAEVAEANALGMRVVVIDHHEPGFVEANGERIDVIPEAVAVVDPKQAACAYPFKALCAAGLAYKIAGAFCTYTEIPFVEHDELLALAAIATVCDIADLQDENRIIVKCGLDALNANKLINPGLGSLITRRGYLDKPLDAYALGFVLGPCINATGRLDSASLSAQLLLAGTDESADRLALAERLTELNEERKRLTIEGVERALAMPALEGEPDKVLVLTDAETHESIAGIVAGRVRETTGRPTILLTRGAQSEDGIMKGSGRSIEGYNLFEALYRHRTLFMRFGGHAMAAGLTMAEENIPLLREYLNAECTLESDDFVITLPIDGILEPDDVTLELSRELERLSPFGKSNREPLFVTYGLVPETMRAIDEKNTLLFTFVASHGRRVKGIGFGLNERFAQAMAALGDVRGVGFVMDAVYGVETNIYNGVASAQMRIRDFRLAAISG